MNVVKKAFSFTNKYIRENVLKCFYVSGIIFVLTGIVAFFITKALSVQMLEEIYAEIGKMLAVKDVVNDDGTLSFLGVFINNLRAGMLISVMGVIPFLFLPALYTSLNSVLVGAVIGIMDVLTDENVFMMFVKFILPHGVFEIPAIVLEGAIGIKICFFLCRKIFGRAKEESMLFHLKGYLGVHIFYIIPFLLIAAFIEAVVLGAIYF